MSSKSPSKFHKLVLWSPLHEYINTKLGLGSWCGTDVTAYSCNTVCSPGTIQEVIGFNGAWTFPQGSIE